MQILNMINLMLIVLSILLGSTTTINAAECDNVKLLYQSCSSLSSPSDILCRNSYLRNAPSGCLIDPPIIDDNPTPLLTSGAAGNASIASTSFFQVSTISTQVSSRFAPSVPSGSSKGMSSGNEDQKWNAWGNVAGNFTNQDYLFTKYELDVQSGVFGGDYSLTKDIVVGLSGSFDNGEGLMNGIFSNSSGYLISPYIGLQLSPEWVIDASIGAGSGEFRFSGSTGIKTNRWFAGSNLTYTRWMKDVIQLIGKIGYLYGEESSGASATNGEFNPRITNRLGRMTFGAQAGYWMTNFMPYAGLSYANDIYRDTNGPPNPIGVDSLILILGVNFFAMNNSLTAGIAYNQEQNRAYQENGYLTANINFRF